LPALWFLAEADSGRQASEHAIIREGRHPWTLCDRTLTDRAQKSQRCTPASRDHSNVEAVPTLLFLRRGASQTIRLHPEEPQRSTRVLRGADVWPTCQAGGTQLRIVAPHISTSSMENVGGDRVWRRGTCDRIRAVFEDGFGQRVRAAPLPTGNPMKPDSLSRSQTVTMHRLHRRAARTPRVEAPCSGLSTLPMWIGFRMRA